MNSPRLTAAFCAAVAAAWTSVGAWAEGPSAVPALLAQYAAFFFLFAAVPVTLRLSWGIVLGKLPSGWRAFWVKWTVAYHVLLAVVFVWLAAFLAYNNEVAPLELPTATLSNGERTVTFKSMSHVGTADFYRKALAEMDAAQASGATILYEGIRPGSAKNLARLRAVLGVDFGTGMYDALASVAGLENQLSFPFSGTGRLNVDLSVDEIMAAYDAASGTGAAAPAAEAVSFPQRYFAWLAAVSRGFAPREKEFLATFGRAALNQALRDERAAQASIRASQPALAAAILDARDRRVAREILSSASVRFYAAYGMMHFQGVYDELRKADPRWDIVSVTFDRPLR